MRSLLRLADPRRVSANVVNQLNRLRNRIPASVLEAGFSSKYYAEAIAATARGARFAARGRVTCEGPWRPLLIGRDVDVQMESKSAIVLTERREPELPGASKELVFAEVSTLGFRVHWKFMNPPLNSTSAIRLQAGAGLAFDQAITLFGASTTVLLLGTILASLAVAHRNITAHSSPVPSWEGMRSVWFSEAGIALIRSLAPLLYAYVLAGVQASGGFIVTYQAILHVAYFCCLPLISALPIAVRDCSEALAAPSENSQVQWWNVLFYTGFLPTVGLLIGASLFATPIFDGLYGFSAPADHRPFFPLFFLACILGQAGHVVSVPLRARKQSKLVTISLAATELIISIGGARLLMAWGMATPRNLALLVVLYAACFLGLVAHFLRRITKAAQ